MLPFAFRRVFTLGRYFTRVRPKVRQNATHKYYSTPRNFIESSVALKMQRKGGKPFNSRSEPQRKKKKGKDKGLREGGADEVLEIDVKKLLRESTQNSEKSEGEEEAKESIPSVVHTSKSEAFPETEVTVSELSSTGEGLALSPSGDHVYVVPFTLPGDKARVRVYRTNMQSSYSLTDLIEVTTPAPKRNDSLINCQYFGRCSGCQLQMLPYEDQLQHKRRIIEKAYANFSGILPELIPTIGNTTGSPLQYGYRTKLTPHFSQNKSRRRSVDAENPVEVPDIGFMMKGRRRVLDIEDCPLGTDIVRRGLKQERKRVAENLHQFKSGATLLVRESTSREEKDKTGSTSTPDESKTPCGGKPQEGIPLDPQDQEGKVIRTEFPNYIEEKSYVTNSNAVSVEYIDNFRFRNIAGSFFQNNNSILSSFTSYVRDNANPIESTQTTATETSPAQPKPKLKYLLDAYCGSGLFTIALSDTFRSSLGIDIAASGIQCARENATLNNLSNTGFAAADAAALFKDVPYPPDQTLLIIDPPRKGCDNNFLQQLLTFRPARVLYVSCNVHTQARDVGVLVEGGKGVRYEIESIKGFDFFPQTSHVESVAVLNKVVVGDASKDSIL